MPDSHAPDIKPRSRDVTDGLEKAAARGMLRAVGMGDDGLGEAADRRRLVAGTRSRPATSRWTGWPRRSRTACTPPAATRSSSAPSRSPTASRWATRACTSRWSRREVIADSVETVMMAERLDGSVLLAGCDKSLPGHADGRRPARPGHRSSSTPARSCPARSTATTSRSSTPSRPSAPAWPARSPARRSTGSSGRSVRARAPAAACTPPTRWPRVAEALGMSLPGLGRAAGGRPPPRRLRAPLRRGRGRDAPPGHHRPPDHDLRGVRERDRRRDGARRLHQRRAPPAGDRPRGRGRPDHRRLQPDRRQGAAPRRPQAVRPLRDERRRQGRRHPDGDEGAARRRASCTATCSP